MAIRTYKVTLDSKNTIAPEPIFLRQGDKTGAVIIDASVTDNGSAFNLDGLTPVFKANTADNEAVIIDSTGFNIVDASNGEFTYKVPGALSTAPGKIRTAYFGFTDPSGVESTFNLTFVVQAAPDVGTVKSENYITVINGTYANIAELTAAYPQGNPGIFVTTNDQNWCYWDDKKGAWIAGGPFNAHPLTNEEKVTVRKYVLDNENLIKNGYFVDGDISALQTNSAVGKKWVYLDGIDWANVSGKHTNGDGKADAYFSLATDDQRLLQLAYESFNFGFDILAQSAARFDIFMDVVTTSETYRTVLEHNLTLELGVHHHVNVVTPPVNEVNAKGSDVLKVNIGLSPIDDSVDYNIGLCKITRFSLPTNLADDQPLAYKVNKMHNLFPDQSLLTHKASEFQCTNGNFSYDEINGERFAKFSYNGSSGWYDAFSSIDIGKNPEVLQDLLNHQHRYEFNGYVKSDTDAKLSVDVFTNDGNIQRVTFGYLHLTAEEMNNFSFIIPKLNTFGLVNLSNVTIVNFVISNVSATDMWINDVRIDTRQARKEAQGKNYLPDSLEEILEQGYLKHGDGIAIGHNHFDGLDWLIFNQNQNNVSGNKDVMISFSNPSHVDKTNTINWQQLKLKAVLNAKKETDVSLRIDIINQDATKNVTISLGKKHLLSSIDSQLEIDTPLISNVASIDMRTTTAINFVLTTDYPDKNFALMITELSLDVLPNNINKPDTIFDENTFNRYGSNIFIPNDVSKDFEYYDNRPAMHIHSSKTNINSDIAFNQRPSADPNMFDNPTELNTTIATDTTSNFSVFVDLQAADGHFIDHYIVSQFQIAKGEPKAIDVIIPALNKLSNNQAVSANVGLHNDMPTDTMSYHLTDFSFDKVNAVPENNNSDTATNTNALPIVKLYGNVPASSTGTTVNSFTYQDGTYVVSGYTKTSWQGQSSESLPKKSYKFKPYSDDTVKTKLSMQTDPKFAPASDFVLKAFYSDPTLSLDNIGNEIMHDLAASRKTFSTDLNSTAYLGQCYGKPIELYFNDIYQGLYFFRSGAKENTYGVDGKDVTKFVVEGESETGASMFQAQSVTKWGDGSGDGLDVEFEPNIPDILTDDQKAKFNAFVKMVNDGDIEKFKANTLQTSVEAAIDYIIFYNLMGSVDSCGRNLEWVTWDNGAHFTVIPYDFDQMFFNDYNGLGRSDKNANGFPVVQMRFGTTHNKYFDLIAQAYPQQLNDRYYELRKSIMREDNIIKRFTDYGSHIGIANFQKDLAKWPLNGRLVNYQYLQSIVYDRFKIVDTQFAAFIAPLLS
ncbi:CotH kinase family protein [Lacticaseibacillus paracasei]|uniref:CotH kinase family protein n=1 Tax=Lacticaseibacillus paracasei TaxID=1597 RepID=UPI002F26407B